MTEVHVVYTGIVCFVPINPGTPPTVDHVRVLIPDARKSHHGHTPHKPYVLVDERSSTIDPPRGLHEIARSGHLVAYELAGYEIDFGLGGLTYNDKWILPLRGACPGSAPRCGKVRSGLWTGKLPPELAARAYLGTGTLEASWVHPERCWRFENRPILNHLAQEVCHRFTISGDRLRIRFKDKDGAEVAALILEPREDGRIELEIGNAEEIFPTNDLDEPEDPHVALFYRLTQAPVSTKLVRIEPCERLAKPPQDRHQHSLRPGRVGLMSVGGANCPPGQGDYP